MPESHLLAVDVGNTNTVLGVFQGAELRCSWRLATLRERTVDELGLWTKQCFADGGLDRNLVSGVVVSSVVPPLTRTVVTMTRSLFGLEPLVVDGDTDTGMRVRYENPSEVGADRIVNGVAAYDRYGRGAGRPVVVVDFGTATTFDVISSAGEYLGGVISPGIQISAEALFERASRLPRVDVRRPRQVIGRTTIASMESGLFFGFTELVAGVLRRIEDELGEPVVCVATGGLAEVIAQDHPAVAHVDPDLTLHGLRLVWERWHGPGPVLP